MRNFDDSPDLSLFLEITASAEPPQTLVDEIARVILRNVVQGRVSPKGIIDLSEGRLVLIIEYEAITHT